MLTFYSGANIVFPYNIVQDKTGVWSPADQGLTNTIQRVHWTHGQIKWGSKWFWWGFKPPKPPLDGTLQVIVSLVGTIPVAVSYSFLLSITPSSLICTFSPPFSLCCLINSLGLMLFVCTWGIILCNAFENILLELLPPHLPGVNWLSMWEKITIPMYRSWFHDLYRLHGPCCPQKPLYSLPEA